ncbi:hypothetical protein [Micropruina sp.]|uniref:hypothetical protein n=1 Tax=Micropruina sp. TaxID=2737536 RepID=UPI0039E6F1A3
MIDVYLAGFCAGAGTAFNLVITEPSLRLGASSQDAFEYGHQMALMLQEDPLRVENVRQTITAVLRAHAEQQTG